MTARRHRRDHRGLVTLAWLLPLVALGACSATAASATQRDTAPDSAPVTATAGVVTPSTTAPAVTARTVPVPTTTAPSATASGTVPDDASTTATAPSATASGIVPADAATSPSTIVDATPNVRSGSNVNAVADVGDPVRVIVPAAGIDGPVSTAGVLADGTVAVPPDPSIAGWFTGGPRPGELGPAVIVGHVDSKKAGPGVFYRLRDVKVGDTATVVTTTGSQQFVAVATERVPKDEFPTARVYGQVPIAALRLITCGGSFDRSIGHYRDNVVVYFVKVPG